MRCTGGPERMIAIVGVEGSRSDDLRRAFVGLGAACEVVHSVDRLERAQKIILPDVGSFPRGIRAIRDGGLLGPIFRAADQGRPILGIGRGLHLFFDVSYEEGQHTGLGVIHGKVTGLDAGGHRSTGPLSLPHQGWGEVEWLEEFPLAGAGVPGGRSYYFDHSHHAEPLDESVVCGRSNYGVDFAAVVRQGNLIGTEFRPERSGEAGWKLLERFARL
jgi:glutamine amidotransferase